MGTFIRSITAGHTERPSYEYKYDPNSGELSVIIPKGAQRPQRVDLRYAQTLSKTRRDFRWESVEDECVWPAIPVKTKLEGYP